MASSTRTVTLAATGSLTAGDVVYQALPNQIVDADAINTEAITASVNGSQFEATLVRGALYRVNAPNFGFADKTFRVPDDSGDIALVDIISGVRTD